MPWYRRHGKLVIAMTEEDFLRGMETGKFVKLEHRAFAVLLYFTAVRRGEALRMKIHSREMTGLASCVALMETKWALFEKKEYAKADKAVSLIEEIAEIVPVDKEVAKEAIDLKIKRKVELLDSIHAITAMMHNAVLVTRDEDLRRKVDDFVVVKKPEDVLKEIIDH